MKKLKQGRCAEILIFNQKFLILKVAFLIVKNRKERRKSNRFPTFLRYLFTKPQCQR